MNVSLIELLNTDNLLYYRQVFIFGKIINNTLLIALGSYRHIGNTLVYNFVRNIQHKSLVITAHYEPYQISQLFTHIL